MAKACCKYRGLRSRATRNVWSVLTSLAAMAGATALWAGTAVEWKGGNGDWEDAAKWGATLPSGGMEARINGTREKPSQVMLAHADALVSHLSLAEGSGSLASLIVDG